MLDRRDFIRSLAAAAVAAGVPLPVGMPVPLNEETLRDVLPLIEYFFMSEERWIMAKVANSEVISKEHIQLLPPPLPAKLTDPDDWFLLERS